MYESFAGAGRRVTLERVGMFADGVAVSASARNASRSPASDVDEIVLVDTDEICAAIQMFFEDTRLDRRAGWRSRRWQESKICGARGHERPAAGRDQ